MKRKIVSGIMLTLLLIGMLTLAFNIQPVRSTGTIYIRADGSIDPPTANITSFDNVTYTFTDNIYDSIVVERSNIIVDGNGYTLQGIGSGNGFNLTSVSNVTIQNVNINNFTHGIWLNMSSNNVISGNNITNNNDGIYIYAYESYINEASNNNITGNNIINNDYGVHASGIDYGKIRNVKISGNSIIGNTYGIYAWTRYFSDCDGWMVCQNYILGNTYGIYAYSERYHGADGHINDWIISGNNIADNNYGITAWVELSGHIEGWTVSDNNISSNKGHAIWAEGKPITGYCDGWTVSGNNITANGGHGIYAYAYALDSINGWSIYHNNISENGGYGVHASANHPSAYIETWTLYGNNISRNGEGGVYGFGQMYGEMIYGHVRFWSISRNNIDSNGGAGIYTTGDTKQWNISRNFLISNTLGIYLGAANNTLRENNMSNNRYNFGVSSSYVQDIDSSNIVDGKPIYYWINRHHDQVPSDAGYVALVSSANITVKNLNLSHNWQGTLMVDSANITVRSLNVSYNEHGVMLLRTKNLTLENIYSINNSYGIYLEESSDCTVYGIRAVNNTYGIYFTSSVNCTITNNNVKENEYGIYMSGSSNNTIYHNNFEQNNQQVVIADSYVNIWDDGYPSGGNYWSDYNGTDLYSGSYQNQTGPDGIGDTPYTIDVNNRDNYPLLSPWSPVTIQNTSITKGGTVYPIQVISNSTILDFKETPGSLKLSVSGANGTSGYVRVIQPIGLNSTRIKVFLNHTRLIPPPYPSISKNSTHYFIYFAFTFNSVYELTIAFPIEGDINYDGIVDIVDVVRVALAFGSTPTDPNWDSHADLNDDRMIDIVDIVIAAIHFGETW